ncbi:hypothetical protein EDL98_06480 [Ornithobacterium rhinotracheale]|uniref:hypothetical protein n=1 Tax=Ornithobacterium rhinotracheale TaxID=28251 RepID=UPI00129CE406|nr:hypothetical protein [Ornithobacterium rhinotracheale]MRJ10729.1 hypothetical protein [Ornithobacterium rhinotracheale]
MKQFINSTIQVLSIILAIALIIHFFVDFGANGKFWLFSAVFFVIGLNYFVSSFSEEKLWVKVVFIICSLYLMVFKFVMEPDTIIQNLLGFFAIFAPIVLGYSGYTTNYLKDEELED